MLELVLGTAAVAIIVAAYKYYRESKDNYKRKARKREVHDYEDDVIDVDFTAVQLPYNRWRIVMCGQFGVYYPSKEFVQKCVDSHGNINHAIYDEIMEALHSQVSILPVSSDEKRRIYDMFNNEVMELVRLKKDNIRT
jgi:hypothetical protein